MSQHPEEEKEDFIPKRISEYREQNYWDSRYSSNPSKVYDWFMEYASLRPHLQALLTSTTMRILVLGCGNSKLSEELYADGFHHITNIDYSPTVIKAMMERTQDSCPEMRWLVMDMRQLDFETASFDLVIDKGSLDAIWSDGGSQWDPSEAVRSDVDRCVREVIRVLPPGGCFVSITFGQPHFRKILLERPQEWHLSHRAIPETFYFIYTATRLGDVRSAIDTDKMIV